MKKSKQFFPSYKAVENHFNAGGSIIVQLDKSQSVATSKLEIALAFECDPENITFSFFTDHPYKGKRTCILNCNKKGFSQSAQSKILTAICAELLFDNLNNDQTGMIHKTVQTN